MSDIKRNITSIFMVPTLKIGREELENNGFINGYVTVSYTHLTLPTKA